MTRSYCERPGTLQDTKRANRWGGQGGELHVGLFPNLRCHDWISMRLYASDLLRSLEGITGVRVELLSPPFDSNLAVGCMRNRWLRYVSYPAWAGVQRADLYHVVDHGNVQLLLRLPGGRTVVTCHDLFPVAIAGGHLHFPGAPLRRAMIATSVRLMLLKKAGAVITDSKHTLDECHSYLHIPLSRLHVAYHGVSLVFRTMNDDIALETFRASLNIQSEDLIILHVGSNDPRKNLLTILHVVARVREQTRRRVRLFKVGGKFGPAELEAIRALHIQDAVLELGEVSLEGLALVYRAATVLLYPSFYEGFCRPVTEAMASGLPVVASTGGAIPEVMGGAAALYDPRDVEGMAERIAAIAGSRALREDMAQAGRETSARFTWRSHGEAVAEVYRTIMSRWV